MLCAALEATAGRAGANSTGIVTYSGKTPGQTCAACHGGGAAPMVRFDGPTQVNAGSATTFTFVVTSQSASQKYAGFDVAASLGQLGTITGQGAQLLFSELTHKAPSKVNASGEASWKFTWHAPDVGGTFTLFGAGNSVDDNKLSTGDASAATTLQVSVVGAATVTPTAMPSLTSTKSPTLTRTAAAIATPTTTPTASATPTPAAGSCAADCDHDHHVSQVEVAALISALQSAAPPPCAAADANGDGVLTASDLARALAAAADPGSGCAP